MTALVLVPCPAAPIVVTVADRHDVTPAELTDSCPDCGDRIEPFCWASAESRPDRLVAGHVCQRCAIGWDSTWLHVAERCRTR